MAMKVGMTRDPGGGGVKLVSCWEGGNRQP